MTLYPSCVHYARYSTAKSKEQHQQEPPEVRADQAASAEGSPVIAIGAANER